ncbi:hypothetical protein PBY51_000398 [Eleginops maclovinus]|nr:hypothetical protein PBY51_000398 [Eleginops maclovinus]
MPAPKWFLPLGLLCLPSNGAAVYHAARSPAESRLSRALFFSAGLNPSAAVNQSRSLVPSPSVSLCWHLNLPPSAHPLAK